MSSSFRFKCPACDTVSDLTNSNTCPKCHQALPPTEGYVQIYRMGSPIGVAVGYGIYINGQPYGHLANQQSVRISLPFGTHTLHFTCGMTRKCEDLTVTLSPEAPVAYMKARMKPGFWTNTIKTELVQESEMPPLES